MTSKLRKYGLIGYPLAHSFSESYFADKFEKEGIPNCEYKAYPIENIESFLPLFEQGIVGLNVTIPYKEQVLEHMYFLSNEAFDVAAVNTIKLVDGKLHGYNTDVYGFEHSMLHLLNGKSVEKAMILGTGGASKAVQYVLEKHDIDFTLVSRSKTKMSYSKLTEQDVDEHKLIINTTPLGTFPNINYCPGIPYEGIGDKHFLFDLVYNPEKTLFLNKGSVRGARIKNGHEMLILQAEKSWEIWNT